MPSIAKFSSRNGFGIPPLFFPLALFSFILLASCKKDGDDEDDFPVLGTCQPQPPTGKFSYNSTMGIYTYQTSGGGHITIDSKTSIKITHNSYPGFVLEYWGSTIVNGQIIISANHETLNGKHIKSRMGNRRTILFPDGAKITWITDGETGPLVAISIYDGAEAHHINLTCNKIEYSSVNQSVAKQLDDMQADGETATFEFTSTGLIYYNVYTEDSPGNKSYKRVDLGEIFKNQPNKVDDYYDDPRRADT